MTTFEIWQVVLGIVTAILLLTAFLGALYVGLKQNDINQNLLDLHYSLSLEIVHTPGQIQIHNKGLTNLFLLGTKLRENEPVIEDKPRLIVPSGYYYLLSGQMEEALLKEAADGRDAQIVPLEVFVESADGKRWVVRTLLYSQVTQNQLQIHTQTVSAIRNDWKVKRGTSDA